MTKKWKEIDVWEEAKKYFEMGIKKCVKYENFLVNHTKKFAIDLADYYAQSKAMTKNGEEYAIDPIPVLTETGRGAQMAFYNGIIDETTEQLAGQWCGDLLQIVDSLPENYSLINCCFAESNSKFLYCYNMFGVNKDGFLLSDKKGNIFKMVRLNLYGKRGPVKKIRINEKEEDGIEFFAAG
jgi:hypothetical protein